MISKKIGPLKSLQLSVWVSIGLKNPNRLINQFIPHKVTPSVPWYRMRCMAKRSRSSICHQIRRRHVPCTFIILLPASPFYLTHPNSISWSSSTSTSISISALVSAYPILPLSRGWCLCTSLCFYLYLRLKICVGASPSLHFLYAFLRLCFVYLYIARLCHVYAYIYVYLYFHIYIGVSTLPILFKLHWNYIYICVYLNIHTLYVRIFISQSIGHLNITSTFKYIKPIFGLNNFI